MYKTLPNKTLPNGITIPAQCVFRLSDMACIPFDPANTDYQQFKKDIMAGGELQDADGNAMADAQEFVKGLI